MAPITCLGKSGELSCHAGRRATNCTHAAPARLQLRSRCTSSDPSAVTRRGCVYGLHELFPLATHDRCARIYNTGEQADCVLFLRQPSRCTIPQQPLIAHRCSLATMVQSLRLHTDAAHRYSGTACGGRFMAGFERWRRTAWDGDARGLQRADQCRARHQPGT